MTAARFRFVAASAAEEARRRASPLGLAWQAQRDAELLAGIRAERMTPAQILADIAADKLARLATDLRHDAADPARTLREADRRAAAIAESRREAASALRSLSDARPAGVVACEDAGDAASYQAQRLEDGRPYDAGYPERLAALWRAFADAA